MQVQRPGDHSASVRIGPRRVMRRSTDREHERAGVWHSNAQNIEAEAHRRRPGDSKKKLGDVPSTFATDNLACNPAAQGHEKRPRQVRHTTPNSYWIELAACEKTVLEFDPISRIVPTTITRITASMTAYSAMSCP